MAIGLGYFENNLSFYKFLIWFRWDYKYSYNLFALSCVHNYLKQLFLNVAAGMLEEKVCNGRTSSEYGQSWLAYSAFAITIFFAQPHYYLHYIIK